MANAQKIYVLLIDVCGGYDEVVAFKTLEAALTLIKIENDNAAAGRKVVKNAKIATVEEILDNEEYNNVTASKLERLKMMDKAVLGLAEDIAERKEEEGENANWFGMHEGWIDTYVEHRLQAVRD